MSDPVATCPHCGAARAEEHLLCPRCGRGFTAQPYPDLDRVAHAETTVQWTGGLPRPFCKLPVDVFTSRGKPHRAVAVDELFAFKKKLVLGRSNACDICLPHPSVSRMHALLEKLPTGLVLRDLDSINGTRVSGRRITEPVLLKEQERVGVGPFLFCLSGAMLHALDSSQSLRLEAHHLEKTVWLARGRTRKLLDNINLAVEPGEFVSLLGPSGSGKSTLMDCLNGRRPATGGRVLANGEDFYLHFNSFRQSLGYVPQRDIVHTQLTVYKALYYTARLRLPTDTEPEELKARIDEVIRLMELGPHQDTLVGNLSGGQIKRVSLGAELLARPCLPYIDEATSGLDAGTEARMMRLFRTLADEGKSVICVTHNVDNVDLCHLITVLAAGRLVFYGPPQETRAFFRVSRVSEIYDRLGDMSPEDWERSFARCGLYREFVENRLAKALPESILIHSPREVGWQELSGGTEKEPMQAPKPEGATRSDSKLAHSEVSALSPVAMVKQERPHRLFLHQFLVLTLRYLEMLWRDPRTLRLLLLQAPIVAIFVLLGFLNKPFDEKILAPRKLNDKERQVLEAVLARYREVDALGQALKPTVELTPAEASVAPELQEWLREADLNAERLRALLDAPGPVVPDRVIVNPRYTFMLLFIMVITILWFGCNNAAREIVKEEAIYARERAVNLGIMPYLASKFVVLSLICAVQVLLMMGLIYGLLAVLHLTLGWGTPSLLYRLELLPQYGMLLLVAMTGVALGLLLSACVASPDRAATLLPYVLIPQIILGGGFLAVDKEPLHTLAVLFSPAYWGFRGVRLGESTLPADFPFRMDYPDHVWLAAIALAGQTLALLLLTAWFLRRKDRVKG